MDSLNAYENSPLVDAIRVIKGEFDRSHAVDETVVIRRILRKIWTLNDVECPRNVWIFVRVNIG